MWKLRWDKTKLTAYLLDKSLNYTLLYFFFLSPDQTVLGLNPSDGSVTTYFRFYNRETFSKFSVYVYKYFTYPNIVRLRPIFSMASVKRLSKAPTAFNLGLILNFLRPFSSCAAHLWKHSYIYQSLVCKLSKPLRKR